VKRREVDTPCVSKRDFPLMTTNRQRSWRLRASEWPSAVQLRSLRSNGAKTDMHTQTAVYHHGDEQSASRMVGLRATSLHPVACIACGESFPGPNFNPPQNLFLAH
jgi:hypothetical protein